MNRISRQKKNCLRIAKSVALLFIFILAGCVTVEGPIGDLPAIPAGQATGEVVIIRNTNFVGAANSLIITLDGQDIFAIRIGQYTILRVASGDHYVGVKCFGGWTPTWKEDSKKFRLAPDKQEYFIVSPDLTCADILHVDKSRGQKAVKESTFVNMPQLKNQISDTVGARIARLII